MLKVLIKTGKKKLYKTNPVEPKKAPAVSTKNFSNKKNEKTNVGRFDFDSRSLRVDKKNFDTELKEQRNSSSASFLEDLDIFNGPSLATLNIAISTQF